jgi:hypothetical protein
MMTKLSMIVCKSNKVFDVPHHSAKVIFNIILQTSKLNHRVIFMRLYKYFGGTVSQLHLVFYSSFAYSFPLDVSEANLCRLVLLFSLKALGSVCGVSTSCHQLVILA